MCETNDVAQSDVRPRRVLPVLAYTVKELEQMTGIKRSTFDTWRFEGRGPHFIKVEGWKVVYPASDFDEWWDSQQRNSGE